MALIESHFSTPIYKAHLASSDLFNQKLLKDLRQLAKQDKLGINWSIENYKNGYTSYASLSDLHHRTPTLSTFQERIEPHAIAFAYALNWDLRHLRPTLTTCWMNFMKKGTHHSLHFHPHSVISGTYYVKVPKTSSTLKIEDPRMVFFMNAPLKKHSKHKNPLYAEIHPKEGMLVLFESWLRHEVPPQPSNDERVSISFNFSLEEI